MIVENFHPYDYVFYQVVVEGEFDILAQEFFISQKICSVKVAGN